MGQGAQVIVDHQRDLLFSVIVVESLEVDEPMAHLSVIAAPRGLQLDLHIVHHHDFLAGHGLVHQWVLIVAEIIFVALQVGETHRVVLVSGAQ